MVSSNPYVGPSPRIKISFPLLSIWADEPISGPKLMTFFPGNENSERESNMQLFNVKSVFTFRNCGFSVQQLYRFITFLRIEILFIKQCPLKLMSGNNDNQ